MNDYWKNRAVLYSPQAYSAAIRKGYEEDPKWRYLLEGCAQAGQYPGGPDGGWRYKFERLHVHGALEKTYGLNAIAGQGTAFERALRVMEWLTAHTWYCGAAPVTGWLLHGKKLSSHHRLHFSYGKAFWRSINCAHKAFILADCLLAVGIAAMPITMISYDCKTEQEGGNCHVTVHVWLPEESRWVMLDPSFNSYISDKNGRALNLIEISCCKQLQVKQYNLNGTQDCREIYLDLFVLSTLLELLVWDGSADRNFFCRNRLLPENVAQREKEKETRAITVAELLAQPPAL